MTSLDLVRGDPQGSLKKKSLISNKGVFRHTDSRSADLLCRTKSNSMRPFVKCEIVVLVQFYLCQIDLFDHYRYAQMRSRSTLVDPNGRRQQKVLGLSSKIKFDAFLDTILESGGREKYYFCRTETWPLPGVRTPPPHPTPLRPRLKHFDARK